MARPSPDLSAAAPITRPPKISMIAFDQKPDPRAAKNTYLAFFDRQTGVLRGTRLMEERWTDKADSVVLYPLGDRLFVRGKTRVEVLR